MKRTSVRARMGYLWGWLLESRYFLHRSEPSRFSGSRHRWSCQHQFLLGLCLHYELPFVSSLHRLGCCYPRRLSLHLRAPLGSPFSGPIQNNSTVFILLASTVHHRRDARTLVPVRLTWTGHRTPRQCSKSVPMSLAHTCGQLVSPSSLKPSDSVTRVPRYLSGCHLLFLGIYACAFLLECHRHLSISVVV